MDDLISRNGAIDAISKDIMGGLNYESILRDLPSAHPEPFTDEEQRIFLSAMGREERVCKHVDAVYEDSYEDGLVRICHEITRKVKGALWT